MQRYEGLLGIPVRCPGGNPSGSVIATKAELDAWVQGSPDPRGVPLEEPRIAVRV